MTLRSKGVATGNTGVTVQAGMITAVPPLGLLLLARLDLELRVLPARVVTVQTEGGSDSAEAQCEELMLLTMHATDSSSGSGGSSSINELQILLPKHLARELLCLRSALVGVINGAYRNPRQWTSSNKGRHDATDMLAKLMLDCW